MRSPSLPTPGTVPDASASPRLYSHTPPSSLSIFPFVSRRRFPGSSSFPSPSASRPRNAVKTPTAVPALSKGKQVAREERWFLVVSTADVCLLLTGSIVQPGSGLQSIVPIRDGECLTRTPAGAFFSLSTDTGRNTDDRLYSNGALALRSLVFDQVFVSIISLAYWSSRPRSSLCRRSTSSILRLSVSACPAAAATPGLKSAVAFARSVSETAAPTLLPTPISSKSVEFQLYNLTRDLSLTSVLATYRASA